MATIIAHNLSAMNAQRNFGIVNKKTAKNTEKLSSGYKINRAADNAAGLAISEKMRGQLRGLSRASLNCEDGMNLVNTADGGMAEIESILQRTRELCVQAANDTNTSEDRLDISLEIKELIKEIDNIGNHTEFNTQKILQGTIEKVPKETHSGVTYEDHPKIPAYFNDDQSNQMVCGKKYYMTPPSPPITLTDGTTIDSESAFILDFQKINSESDWQQLDKAGFSFVCSLGCQQEFTFIFDSSSTGITDQTPSAIISGGGTSNNKVFSVGTKNYTNGQSFVTDIVNFVKTLDGTGTNKNVNVGHDNKIGAIGDKLVVYGSQPGGGDDGYLIIGKPNISSIVDTYEDVFRREQLRIQVGANSGQELVIELPHIDSYVLKMQRIDVLSHETASSSITYVDEMLQTLNDERGRMGAYYNRLEHAIEADDIMNENLTSAEARIRDTDIADEMTAFAKNNILSQAGQAMLANANSDMQNVLALLS